MAMIVISSAVMCCQDCGGFHFLGKEEDGRMIVTHPQADRYKVFNPETMQHSDCPNTGKRFAFPKESPILGIEV